MTKICYFTSKGSNDIRVFVKECTSLVKAGYEVYLVSSSAENEIKNGVHIIKVPYNKKGIFNRLLVLPRLLYKEALKVDADIYHFNDPASLRYGTKLKRKGKKVIFDSFEDHPTLVFEKKSMPYIIKLLVSRIYSIYEFKKCKKFDGLILCYHWTQERLEKACKNNQLVFNFPFLNIKNPKRENIQVNTICYAGLIAKMWKIENIIKSLAPIEDINFILAGNPADKEYLEQLQKNENWQKVKFLGQVKREAVNDEIFMKSNIGIALLDYIPLCKGNIGNLSNNKLFEYMMAGLPVICTDFVLWKEVVEENKCGICVNPNNINEITNAIKYLIDNPDIALQMGENGRKIIQEKYNWEIEEKKLLEVYRKVLS